MTGFRVVLDYTNWRGERARREVAPVRFEWGSNEWHPDPQWLLVAVDCAKGDERTFAASGIHAVEPVRAAP